MLNTEGFSALSRMSEHDCWIACRLVAKYDLREFKFAEVAHRRCSILDIDTTPEQLSRLVKAGFLEYGGQRAKMVRIRPHLVDRPAPRSAPIEESQPEPRQPLKRSRAAIGLAPFIPIVLLEHAAKALGIEYDKLRGMIRDRNIPIYSDPEMGALLTVKDFYTLVSEIHPAYTKHRFDRQMFFQIMANLHSGEWCDPSLPMGYDQRVEMELARVAKLPVNERAIRGMEIYKNFMEAMGIIEAVPEIKNKKASRIAGNVNKLMRTRKLRYRTQSKGVYFGNWRDLQIDKPILPDRRSLPETPTPQQYPSPPQEQDGQSENPHP
jgi:hypothetical protein